MTIFAAFCHGLMTLPVPLRRRPVTMSTWGGGRGGGGRWGDFCVPSRATMGIPEMDDGDGDGG